MLEHMANFEFGWIVGLIEGEGCPTVNRKRKYYQPELWLSSTDKDVMDRFIFWVNKTFPPQGNHEKEAKLMLRKPKGKSTYKMQYIAQITSRRALDLMTLIYPYMSERRRAQINRVMKRTRP